MDLAPWPDAPLDPGGRALLRARLPLHHAVQVVAAVGQSLAPRAPDDSQQSLSVAGLRNWLGAPVAGGKFRAGIDPLDVEVRLCDVNGIPLAGIGLEGRTLRDGLAFLGDALARHGQRGKLEPPEHPADFPHHPLADGGIFPEGGAQGRAELLRMFHGTQEILRRVVASRDAPIRLWPHHFDVGCQLGLGKLTAWLGASPGDGADGVAYWYATMSPWPGPERMSPLEGGGAWRREGLSGGSLPISDLAGDAAGQGKQVEAFFRSALLAVERAAAEI